MALPPIVPEVLHPVFVHFPLVLLPLAALAVTLHKRIAWGPQAMVWLVVLAAVTSVAAVTTGILERTDIEAEHDGTEKGDWFFLHKVLGFSVGLAAVVLGALAWRTRARLALGGPRTAWAAALWSVAVVAYVGAWLGGAVVWEP